MTFNAVLDRVAGRLQWVFATDRWWQGWQR